MENIKTEKDYKINVTLITYNHEKFIERAYKSIKSQKTNFDFSITIYDDNSTDKTQDIIQNLIKNDEDSFAVLRKENVGVVENVYQSYIDSKTKYIAMLEGDDYWCDDTKLQQQYDALENNPDCSICGHDTFLINTSPNEKNKYKGKKTLFEGRMKENNKIFKFPDNFKIHPSSKVYRKLKETNVKNKEVLVYDSCSYWHHMINGNLFYINKPMSAYNYTGEGIFSGATKKRRKLLSLRNVFIINKEYDFKYNEVFEPLFTKKLSLFNKLTFNAIKKFNLGKAYEFIINKYK
jgi:glycosyltransferase involved in cell wall biosynthesis